MALTVITSQRKVRRFLVWDLEWVPGTMQLRICGVYDGNDKKKKYRCYRSIDQFLDSELTDKNRGKWFYAHAGGLSDMTFVFQKIVEAAQTKAFFTYSVDASFSGSSAIIVKLRKGKNVFTFIDSYWLLREKLAKIGEWTGHSKGHSVAGWEDMSKSQRENWYATVERWELIQYNEQDCYILWHAIHQFQETLLAMGGQLQMTLASCAMHLFRRRFLKNDIHVHPLVNEKAEETYFSSRVEIFQESCENAYYYDINSSFPYAMVFPCPGQMISWQRDLPKRRHDAIYMADVDVTVPESYLPPLPYRLQKRVFFPFGRWRSWMTQVDLELLLTNGGKLNKVHGCIGFEPFDDLKEYAEMFYKMKKNAVNDFERGTAKLLLNSLYGKFGESNMKERVVINPEPEKEFELRRKEEIMEAEMLFPGAWVEDIKADVPHMHVAIAAHITAFARRTLFNFLKKCKEIYYSDTDSVITTEDLPTSDELGGLKREYIVNGGRFYQPKLYLLEAIDKDGKKKMVHRAKGFSLGDKEAEIDEKFQRIINGEEVNNDRMIRVKELLRDYSRGTHSMAPRESETLKRVRSKVNPWDMEEGKPTQAIQKRYMYPDGDSRPWGIDELENRLMRQKKRA